jgi:hypothetical protein
MELLFLILDYIWIMFAAHWLITVPVVVVSFLCGWKIRKASVVWLLLLFWFACWAVMPMVPGAAEGSAKIVYWGAPFVAVIYVLLAFGLGQLTRISLDRYGFRFYG